MKRSWIEPTLAVFLLSVPIGLNPVSAANPRATVEATPVLAQDDHPKAIAVLEALLSSASRDDRCRIIEQLVDAYSSALKSAEACGNKDEADTLRDNLEILRSNRRDTLPVKPRLNSPGITKLQKRETPSNLKESAVDPLNCKPRSTADDMVKSVVLPFCEPPASQVPEPAALPAVSTFKEPTSLNPKKVVLVEKSPSQSPIASEDEQSSLLKSADLAFLSKNYEEAGNFYKRLASQRSLPEDRRMHWAYCRAVSVVKRINDEPTSSTEWATIDAEIRAIQNLSPGNWFAEYLRNLTSERSRNEHVSKKRLNSRLIVRGSSPEERARKEETPANSGSLDSSLSTQRPDAIRLPGSELDWNGQPVTSNNFHVHYVGASSELANQVAQAAEQARAAQMKRWGVVAATGSWTPRCEILLYPSADEFGRDTKQPAESPGFSSMGMNAGRIVFRRVHLRANHPNLVKAVLPHEVTHVVLADIFPEHQIPRWADEGAAVLSEPNPEQAIRAADLEEPLKLGKLFRLSDLMNMDYPDPKHWSLYYAQSVSLTRFLVESGTPSQFISFVKQAQNSGIEAALNSVYKIESQAALQKRWLAFAKERATVATNVATSNEVSKSKTR